MTPQKGECYEAVVEGYTADGRGVAHIAGCAIFLPNTVAGERVRLRIVKAGKTWAEGRITEILEKSPHRVNRECPYAKLCGGCDFWHLDYAEETRLKARRVQDSLNRLAGERLAQVPILAAQDCRYYRNKAQYPVAQRKGRVYAGFFRAGTHDVVEVDRCRILMPHLDQAKDAVLRHANRYHVPAYDEALGTGLLRHIFVRRGAVSGQVLVCLVVNGSRYPHPEVLIAELRRVPGFTSLVLSVNRKRGNTILGDEFITLHGPGYIEDTLCGLTFRLSPRSFYQVNHDQAQRLYAAAISLAEIRKTDTVLDLYCGVGTITLAMAASAGQVIGVEVIPQAVADARENARRNGIENAEFFCGDAGQAAQSLADQGIRPNVIVVDPPRKGLSAGTVQALLDFRPERIVYVSCDPATLARDISLLKPAYRLAAVQSADLFPRCAHVETVCSLVLEKTTANISNSMDVEKTAQRISSNISESVPEHFADKEEERQMKGSECKFVKYMEGSDKRFVIPVYQRNYDWKTENCKQLYDDLVKIIKGHRKSHFFGSLVSVYNPDGRNEEFLIIDGQQRLTTVSLLFLAMYNLIDKGVIVPETANLKQRIFEEYLVDKWKPKDTRIKLKPVKNDQAAFGRLFSDPAEHIRESNLTVNYDYFYDRIQKQEITIDQLFDAICCLEIINIRLDMDDNPQLIFESLNSTGLDLSEGDKIRNFILMGLPSKEQEDYYEKYWNRIEVCTKYDVSAFIRDYLSVKQQAIPQQKKIYANFKDFVELGKIETEPLLSEMLAYAKRYQILLDGKTGSIALDACIFRLNRLETTVTRPFFLEVLRLYNENKLTLAQVTEIFLTTENYLFRRTICDLPTNALNKIFLMLHREIIRYDGTEDNYVEKLKYALLSKKERARFPDDAEFKAAFEVRPVYLMNSKNKIYILERFENFGTSEDKDVYRHCDDGTYSIEHIMPQHLTPVWQKELGEDYEQIHELWLHRMANLTLTAYNSKYSNSSFTEKKTMQNGFDDSGIRMNTWIAKKDKWTLAELEERSEYLMGRALTIWAAPTTEYKPEEKQLDTYTLEDEGALTGRLIVKFTFKNTEQPVTSWVEMFQKVIQILYAEDKTIITRLAMSEEENIALHFSMKSDASAKPLEIGDGIYALANTSTQSKLSVLSRLFKLYDEDPADLVFYLRDENEAATDEPGSFYELRRKYWAYALPIIQKAHDKDGAFSNIRPTKGNWVNGFFGVTGFYLCCVANYDAARAEVVFGRGNKQENKDAFDSLYAHKAKIESALGTSLQWNRGDDIKSSKVFIQLSNISIENKTDWLRMANFQADWTKKFYDVIVPYIKG